MRAVVDDPDAVEVEVDEGGRRTALNVHVGPRRHGPGHRQAGPGGQAIRTVVRAAAVRDGVEVDIEFLD